MTRRALLLALLASSAARAQLKPPPVQMLGPEAAIALTHRTRSERLRRIVDEQGITPSPTFADYIIPRMAMPPGFPYDTPVLRIVFPENTFFATGSAEILPSSWPIIQAMAELMDGDVPGTTLFVAGHTDNRGGELYNHNLSIARARAVARSLRDAGAALPDIWSVGFGESLPLFENDNALGMSYNRRVEFLLSARLEAAAVWLKDQAPQGCVGANSLRTLECLASIRRLPTFIVEPAERRRVVRLRNDGVVVEPGRDRPPPVAPVQRSIIVNLAERTYVIRQPRM